MTSTIFFLIDDESLMTSQTGFHYGQWLKAGNWSLSLQVWLEKVCKPTSSIIPNISKPLKTEIIVIFSPLWAGKVSHNKLASLEATLVRNYDQRLADGGEV